MKETSRQLLEIACVLFILLSGGNMNCQAEARADYVDITKPEFFPILPWDPYHGWGKPLIERDGNSGLE
ncbi:MAG TPA: hypothetical protein VFC07_04550, partial [Verrucomicrobiae bacterium]|nr:hypothetical protein [Verrucomicrobiae bacterium]